MYARVRIGYTRMRVQKGAYVRVCARLIEWAHGRTCVGVVARAWVCVCAGKVRA